MNKLNGYTAEQAVRATLRVLRDPKSDKMKERLEDPNDPDRRCCLGHLCHAVGLPRILLHEGLVVYGHSHKSGNIDGVLLPADLRELLRDEEGIGHFAKPIGINNSFFCSTLTDVNDFTELSSLEIADVIEREWESGNLWPNAPRD